MGQKLKSPNIRIYTDEEGMKEFYRELLDIPHTRTSATKKLRLLQEQQLLWGYTKEREEEIENLKSFLEKA